MAASAHNPGINPFGSVIARALSQPCLETLADGFILHAIQEWGDPPEVLIKAVQDVLDAAGFSATATCWAVFGGVWPKPCVGLEGSEASIWLQKLTDTMQRGKFEKESAHVATCIKARQATS